MNMCAALVLSIFSGAWFQIGLRGLPLDRVMFAIVVLQLVLHAPGAAQTPRPRLRRVHLLMGVAALYVAASAAAAGTLTQQSGFLSLVDMFGLAPYLVYFLAPAVFHGDRERDMLLVALVGLGAYLGVTALFESLGPHSLVFPHYIARVDAELPDERAGGPFQSSVVEGFATYACAVAAVIAVRRWRAPRARAFAVFVAAVCTMGCFVTLERGVWIAALAGGVSAALVRRRGRRILLPALLTGGIALAGVLALSPSLSQKASARVGNQNSVWARQNQTAAGLRMLAAKPVFGFGWNRYKPESLAYFRQAPDYPQNGYLVSESLGEALPPLPLHDTYLAFAVELGVVGLTLWLAVLLWGVGGAIARPGPSTLLDWKLGLLALLVFYIIVAIVDPHEQAFLLILLWAWAGVAYGPDQSQERAASGRLRRSRPGPRALTRRASARYGVAGGSL